MEKNLDKLRKKFWVKKFFVADPHPGTNGFLTLDPG
jgi:hypothetical protein